MNRRPPGLGIVGPPVRASMAMASALALCGTSVACATIHMEPPAEAGQDIDDLQVVGLPEAHGLFFNEDFAIGRDKVSHVKRGLAYGASFQVLFGFSAHEKTGYQYDVKHDDATLHGECDVDTSENGAIVGRFRFAGETVRIACSCRAPEAPPQASVVVAFANGNEGGTLMSGDRAYPVTVIHDVAGGGMRYHDPAGYRVDGERFVAAVDVLPPGHVWVNRTLESDDEVRITCLFAGLLLYVPTPTQSP